MYKKVLVPLDGSELAECALPQVRLLAQKGCIGKIILLTAVDYPSALLGEGGEIQRYHDVQEKRLARAREYLEDVQRRFHEEGIEVQAEIMEGRADQNIVDFAKNNSVDLLVIASHGYTGIKQWVFGSTALRVLHDSHVPVLLIRPES